MRWTARWITGLVGVALLAGALWGGHLGIGQPGSFGPTHLAAGLLGSAALGAAVAGRRTPPVFRTSAVILLNSTLLLGCLELGAAGILQGFPAEATPLPGESSPYYHDKQWASAYWREFHALRQAYHPYFLWRSRPFRGRYINVDSTGLRETPGARCGPGAYLVATFGGSTLWGWGEPDSASLGTDIQTELGHALADPVCLRNFAQLGSNSTQDLIQLLRELQAGRVPRLVIFYSGVNEVIPPFGYGEAGAHFDLRIIRARVEGALDPSRGGRANLTGWLAGSSLWQLVSRVSGAGSRGRIPVANGPFVSQALADSIVTMFVTNVVALEALAARYGFRAEVFWQPNALVGAKPLTAEERAMKERERITPLIQAVYARVSCVAGRYEHLHDLSNVLADVPGLVYLDWNHANATGNRIIARAIAEAVRAGERPGGASGRPAVTGPVVPAECLGSRPVTQR